MVIYFQCATVDQRQLDSKLSAVPYSPGTAVEFSRFKLFIINTACIQPRCIMRRQTWDSLMNRSQHGRISLHALSCLYSYFHSRHRKNNEVTRTHCLKMGYPISTAVKMELDEGD